jgi:dihydrolipoamide dehydrogenase
VIETVFRSRGMTILGNARADVGPHTATACSVTLADGRDGRRLARADGGRLGPNTAGLGLPEYGVASPTAATSRWTGSRGPTCPASTPPATAPACSPWPASPPCRAASRCGTRSGEAVAPLRLKTVSANVFTDPELATVGVSQSDVDSGRVPAGW